MSFPIINQPRGALSPKNSLNYEEAQVLDCKLDTIVLRTLTSYPQILELPKSNFKSGGVEYDIEYIKTGSVLKLFHQPNGEKTAELRDIELYCGEITAESIDNISINLRKGNECLNLSDIPSKYVKDYSHGVTKQIKVYMQQGKYIGFKAISTPPFLNNFRNSPFGINPRAQPTPKEPEIFLHARDNSYMLPSRISNLGNTSHDLEVMQEYCSDLLKRFIKFAKLQITASKQSQTGQPFDTQKLVKSVKKLSRMKLPTSKQADKILTKHKKLIETLESDEAKVHLFKLCQVCRVNSPSITLGCGHFICHADLSSHIMSNFEVRELDEAKYSLITRCYLCNYNLTESELHKVLDSNQYNTVMNVVNNYKIKEQKFAAENKIYCIVCYQLRYNQEFQYYKECSCRICEKCYLSQSSTKCGICQISKIPNQNAHLIQQNARDYIPLQANLQPYQQVNLSPARQANPHLLQQPNPQLLQQANPQPFQQAYPQPFQQANPTPARQAYPQTFQQPNPTPAQKANQIPNLNQSPSGILYSAFNPYLKASTFQSKNLLPNNQQPQGGFQIPPLLNPSFSPNLVKPYIPPSPFPFTNAKKVKCPICDIDFNLSEIVTLWNCEHQFCRGDIKRYTIASIENKQITLEGLKCPYPDCPKLIAAHIMQEIFKDDEEGWTLYNSVLISMRLKMTYCPKCGTAHEHENRIATCIRCEYQFCTLCHEECHDGRCEDNDLIEAIKAMRISERVTQCPGCKIPYYKDPYCDHVKCANTSCGIEFCFDCGCFRNPTLAHGNQYHRPQCNWYRPNPEEDIYIPDKCIECNKTGELCQKPVDLKVQGILTEL